MPALHGGAPIPFTPFHFGPGLLVKACIPRSFWFSSFVAANVLIDVEVLVYIVRNDPPIHRHLHTYVGGAGIGILAGVLMFATMKLLRRCRINSDHFASGLTTTKSAMLGQSLIAGLVGGVSHILLDSLMHRDMRPWWPLSDENGLAGMVSVGSLHGGCALAGLFGLVLLLLLRDSGDSR